MATQGMKWRPVPAELARLFGELVSVLPPDVERRKMFGCPCVFVNNQMFAGVHQENLMLRLPEAERQALVQAGGAPFEPMPGRVMREYVVAPKTMLAAPAALSSWLDKAYAYARALPAKPSRKK
jgi:TfoX/Sxy family transcriptional regulator of competence genes